MRINATIKVEAQKAADLVAQPEIIDQQDGFPVITAETYRRLYRTDVRAAGGESCATFDFQGYVQGVDPKRRRSFMDAIATNGIQADESQPGIHVGTDGTTSYDDLDGKFMNRPGQVGEYLLFISIPGPLQRKMGCVVRYDGVVSVANFKEEYEEYGDPDQTNEKLDDVYGRVNQGGNMIVKRLPFEPGEDPLARLKVAALHQAIVAHLQKGGNLHTDEKYHDVIDDMIGEIEELRERDLRAKIGVSEAKIN